MRSRSRWFGTQAAKRSSSAAPSGMGTSPREAASPCPRASAPGAAWAKAAPTAERWLWEGGPRGIRGRPGEFGPGASSLHEGGDGAAGGRIFGTGGARYAANVVHNEIGGQATYPDQIFQDPLCHHVDLDIPAQAAMRSASGRISSAPAPPGRVRFEPDAADAALVQVPQRGVRERVVDNCNAAGITQTELTDGIQGAAVIRAVVRGCDDHCALGADPALQRPVVRNSCLGWAEWLSAAGKESCPGQRCAYGTPWPGPGPVRGMACSGGKRNLAATCRVGGCGAASATPASAPLISVRRLKEPERRVPESGPV